MLFRAFPWADLSIFELTTQVEYHSHVDGLALKLNTMLKGNSIQKF